MNQKAAYELTITEKLEQLTVPDMVDAIWARIETQLDIDMPPDQGPSEPPSSPLTGGGLWIGSLFIAALIATIYFITNKSNTNNNQQNPADSINIINSPVNTIDRSPPSPDIQSSPTAVPGQNNSIPAIINNDSTVTPFLNDSIVNAIPDSIGNDLAIDAPPITRQPDTVSKKKGRGVKGIKDSDYRIEPVKKDSTN